MASISYDGQSFQIDGRRRWLVSGVLSPTRMARGDWEARLRAARQAGLNCVCVPVVWRDHEPAPGTFDFEGERDIAEFIRLCGALGLLVVLRAGPFVDDGHDLGGLPAWLLEQEEIVLRSNSGPFLEASSRWLSALMRQVRDLQITARGDGGPILLVQVEHEWFCGDDETGAGYLGELGRYLRENGLSVPLLNTNNLYQQIEGEIDGWTTAEALQTTMRQLRHVRPDAPRLLTDVQTGGHDHWGHAHERLRSPDELIDSLAQALAAGAQFQVMPFHGGTSFGFDAGRAATLPEGFCTTSHDCGAPLTEAGGRGAMFAAGKRVCTFASSFERVFAGLDPDYHPIALDPASRAGKTAAASVPVVHCRGPQGSVAFVFGDPSPKAKRGEATLMLPSGVSLKVDLRGQPVVWALIDVVLANRSVLDFCNLSAFALVGDTFVCFGPNGAEATISINGSVFQSTVPSGKTPVVEEHEGVTLVVCNESQIDAAIRTNDAIYVGCAEIDASGEPVPAEGFAMCHRIGKAGEHTQIRVGQPAKPPRAPALSKWERASAEAYVSGTSERFARIEGPAPLERLGAPMGYGWLRATLKAGATKKHALGVFELRDRAHLFIDGKLDSIIGEGPGATPPPASVSLKKGETTAVLLVDNLGRWSGGNALGEPAGLFGEIYDAKPLKAGKQKLETATPLRPLDFRSPLWGVHSDDRTAADRVTWRFEHRRKSPVFLLIDQGEGDGSLMGLVVLNDEIIDVFSRGGGLRRIRLPEEPMKRGKNVLQLAVVGDPAAALKWSEGAASLYEGAEALSGKEWAFAKWEPPAEDAFESVAKSAMRSAGGPVWWRCAFRAKRAESPLFFDVSGLTKGQLFLNGRNLGRYFVATNTGKKVPPQSRHHLPTPWLREDKANEIMIFDEHGAAPSKCRFVYDPLGPFGG